MGFELGTFTNRLIELFLGSPLFPYLNDPYIDKNGNEQKDSSKHSKRQPLHLNEAMRNCINSTRFYQQDMITFDIGNEEMEIMHPYYHILEDTPYIRKVGMSTKKTRGSQAKVEPSKRDYGRVNWNGKTFTKEYTRNVRGARNRTNKVSHWTISASGNPIFVNRESNSYLNKHYHYIENILDSGILQQLAQEQGLKMSKRKIDTGLLEEFMSQDNGDLQGFNVLDAIASFN